MEPVTPNPVIMEILAGGMVIVAVAYIVWFFYDYVTNGPEPPGPWGFR